MSGRQIKRRGFTLIEMMIVVAILGILAAIAIPAFVKYVRRSKTTEALMNLRKIFDGSVTYFENEHANRLGARIPMQFPGQGNLAPGETPGRNACCGQPSGGAVVDKCLPENERDAWDHVTWQALSFGVDDPHYFWYNYVSTGVGVSSSFTARAHGNLNCDDNNVFSTFERVGVGSPTGGVVGGAGIFSRNEVE
ncbi:MAG: prepilin-type N-terminal cleavage/methylation domain-containing protein [Myxococcales bacterium]|nr:prepilin-type N-terminal cleavage/methylation domain-containing protein [Myxococcales bacterium]